MNFRTARVAPEKAVFRPALPLWSQPEFTGEHMATMTYREQLLHPNWQRKRLEIMQRDHFACARCGEQTQTLHVHHKHYVKGRLAWEYAEHELLTLCEGCHEQAHSEQEALKDVLASLQPEGPTSVYAATAFLAGWAHLRCGRNLYEHHDTATHSFTLGRLASLLDGCPYDCLWELGAALATLTPGQRRAAITGFALALVANPPREPLPLKDFEDDLDVDEEAATPGAEG